MPAYSMACLPRGPVEDCWLRYISAEHALQRRHYKSSLVHLPAPSHDCLYYLNMPWCCMVMPGQESPSLLSPRRSSFGLVGGVSISFRDQIPLIQSLKGQSHQIRSTYKWYASPNPIHVRKCTSTYITNRSIKRHKSRKRKVRPNLISA